MNGSIPDLVSHPWRWVCLSLMTMLMSSMSAEGQSLITMSNKCFKQVESGKAALDAGNYQEAIGIFDGVLDKCSAKDAKQEGNIGKARAYNGLGNYGEALAAAETAIEVNENNVEAWFEKGVAYNGLNQLSESEAAFEQIITLTEKNQNTKDRAGIYGKMAELSFKQGMTDQAMDYIGKALELDPDDTSFYILRGDMKAQSGMLDAAFEDYDKAVALGKADQEMYVIRSSAVINAMQKKYNTTNSTEMSKKMTAEEKSLMCGELSKARELGLKDMQLDLLYAMTCK